MKAKKMFFVCGLFLIVIVNNSSSQTSKTLDSIKTVLQNSKIDSNSLKFFFSQIESNFNNQINIQSEIGTWVIENAISINDKKLQAKAYNALGYANIDAFKGKEAIDFFIKSIKICEVNNFPEIQCKSLLGLSRFYRNNEQQLESISYLKQALEIAKNNNLVTIIINCKFALSATLEGLDKRRSMDTFILVVSLKKEAMLLSGKDSSNLFNNTLGLAETYSNYKYFDSAIKFLGNAKQYITNKDAEMTQLKFLSITAKVYKEKATAQNSKEDFKTAIVYNKQALDLSEKLKAAWWTNHLLKGLAIEHEGIGDYNNAYKYMLRYTNLHDSLFEAQNFTIISDIKNKFETQKKENEIINLNAINSRKSILNKILIGSVVGLFVLGILIYRNINAKRKLQKAKITELEKDKQLLAIDAMLKGQEAERSRIAKDLHDGLGSMLSGVKLNFVNMKENLIMDNTNVIAFENSILQLDNTIAELRKVAHNLMPESLVKFGFKNAILDYCNSLQISSKVKIIYEQMGMERELGNTTDVYIYRIIQELVNNAVKHANASQILIQLTKNPTNVLITVEDNGKGVDKITMLTAIGIGMKSVQQRVDYLKGTIEIDSKLNEGVSFHIELQA